MAKEPGSKGKHLIVNRTQDGVKTRINGRGRKRMQ